MDLRNRVLEESIRKKVLIAALIFLIVVGFFSIHRYTVFFSNTDHGIFNQVFWNSVQGQLFQSSLSSQLSTNVVHHDEIPTVLYRRLGQHFTPSLLLWMPIYALFQNPITLNVLQVVLITCAGIVLFQLAQYHVQPRLALMIVLSFYGANAVIGPAVGNFYDYCQIPLYIFTLLWAIEKRWWWLFGIAMTLTLLVREDAAVVLFGVGLYFILSRRCRVIGAVLCVVSIGYLLFVTNWAMPQFSSDISERFMIERFGQFVEDDTASTIDMIWAIVTQPSKIVVEIFSPADKTFKYMLGHWLPLAFIPAIAPASWIMAGPPLLQILLQRGDTPMSINVRYATAIVPGFFYGAIIWWKHRESFFKGWFRKFWILCLLLSLLFTFTSNPHRAWFFLIPDSIQPWIYRSLPSAWNHAIHANHLLSKIPGEASVSASRTFIPALSSRRVILKAPEIRFVDDENQRRRVDYFVADIGHLLPEAEIRNARNEIRQLVPAIDRFINNGTYGIIDFEDDIVLLKRRTNSKLQPLEEWQELYEAITPILQ